MNLPPNKLQESLVSAEPVRHGHDPVTVIRGCNPEHKHMRTLAAYLESSASMSEARWADPGIGGLETQVDYLQGQILVSKQAIRRLSTDVQLDIARARYLAQSLPLRDWEGKARRLEAIIPIFRSENARLRGIDVHNIVAFKEPCRSLELPILGSEHFEVPPQVDVCERDFNDLRGQMYAVSVTE